MARVNLHRLSLALWPFVLSSACLSTNPPARETLVVYSWLTSGSERDALEALFGVVRLKDPAINITNAAQNDSALARQELATNMAQGDPPDSFQVVSGSGLKEWVSKKALEPLDALATSQGWASVIPRPVLESASQNGSLYGVPLDIERDNTLFYSKGVFDSLGLAPPDASKSMADVMTMAATLQASGVTPFAVSREGWTIASQLFETVLVAEAGPDFYEAYLTGQKTADTPEVRSALGIVAQMMDYANADRTSIDWTGAVARVCSGQAAMLILPDFVKGEFAHDRCGAEMVGYVPMQPPDTPTFVFVSIIFELPQGASNRGPAIEFLKTVGSKEGQEKFNPLKGAIPARTDATPMLDAISRHTLADFRASGERLVPGYAALTSSAFQDAINAALKDFVDPANINFKNVRHVIAILNQNYYSLHP